MNQPSISRFILRSLFYCLIFGALASMIVLQAIPAHGDDLYAEGSLTEWMQIQVLSITMLLFYWGGVVCRERKGLMTLLIGFFMMVFVREMDRAFDNLYDGAWQVTVVFIIIVTGLLVFRNRGGLKDSICEFIETRACGFMSSGVILVFIFSRLYGQKSLWKAVMGEKFMYSVKAASEENVELVGYCLIMIAAMEWLSICFKKRKDQELIDG